MPAPAPAVRLQGAALSFASPSMQLLARAWTRFFPNPGYYGWVVVGLGFLASVLTAPGQSFIVALYLEPMMADLGLSRMEISSIFGFATLAAAACLPFVGRWADRIPSGRFLAIIFALLALTMAGMANVRGVLGLTVGFFFLRLLAHGAVGLGTLTATVRWFRRYRGRALAIVGLGYAFGGVVFPGLVYLLLEQVGWRASLLLLSAIYFLVVTPLIGRFIRERSETDDPIDGGNAVEASEEGNTEPHEISFTLPQAIRTTAFWGLLVGVAVVPVVHTAVIFHQVALFASLGWDAALVPAAFMTLSVTAVLMTYVTGLWLERVPTRFGLVLTLGLSTTALGALALPLSPVAGSLLYATLLGLASGAYGSTRSILWPDYFGIEALGAVKGVVQAAMSGATALGPAIAAALVTPDGSFRNSLLLFAAICSASAVGAMWLRKPVPPNAAEGAAMTGQGSASSRSGQAA